MAEIKVEQREFNQPGAPSLAPAAAAYGQVGQAIQGLATTAVDIKVAMDRTEEAILAQEASNHLTKELVESSTPENFMQGNAHQRYLAKGEGTIEGYMKSVPYTQKRLFKARLNGILQQNALNLFEKEKDFFVKRQKEELLVTLDNSKRQLQEAIYSGSPVLAEQAEAASLQVIEGMAITGALSPIDAYKEILETEKLKNVSKIVQDYRNLQKVSPEKADIYLKNISENKPNNISIDEWESAKEALINERVSQLKLKNSISALSDAEFNYSVGRTIFTEQDVYNFVSERKLQGREFTQADILNMLTEVRKLGQKNLKSQESMARINNYVASGNTLGLAAESSSDIDNWYIETRKGMLQQQSDLINSKEPINEKILGQAEPWMIGATLAAQSKVAIPQWQADIHAQVNSNNPDDVIQAAKAYHYVKSKNLGAVEKINDRDKAFMEAIIDDMQMGKTIAEETVKRYTDDFLKPSDIVLKNREVQFKKYIDNNPSITQNISSGAFGAKFKNTITNPGADMYGMILNRFEREFYATGDANKAKQNTINFLKEHAGSSIFANGAGPVWNPPENLYFYDFGNIVRNQATKYLYDVTNQYRQHPGQFTHSIEWSDKMPKFPEALSEEDWFKGKYDKGQWWLKIDGVDRKVSFISPNFNQANFFPESSYQVMYEKDGRLENLMVLKPGLNGEAQRSYGVMAFLSPTELTPNLVGYLEKETAAQAQERSADRFISRITETPSDVVANRPDIEGVYNEANELKKIESLGTRKNKKKILEMTKKETGKKIEAEKLRRQEEKAAKLIKGEKND